jgi:Host cell surface-exposed lipoprotein
MSDYGQPDPNQYPNTIRPGDPVPPDSVVGNSPLWQGGQHQAPKPPKKHTVRNIILGVFVGIFLVIGGCTALVGGALSSQDAKAPVTVTSQAGTPAATPSAVKSTTQPSPKVTHKPAPPMTAAQVQAIGSAESYLSFTAFSRKGLIRQLSSDAGEGFSVADATFAVDHIKVNWNEQAAKSAESYLKMSHFSRSGLIRQLESDAGEGFTHKQAVYGVTKAGL